MLGDRIVAVRGLDVLLNAGLRSAGDQHHLISKHIEPSVRHEAGYVGAQMTKATLATISRGRQPPHLDPPLAGDDANVECKEVKAAAKAAKGDPTKHATAERLLQAAVRLLRHLLARRASTAAAAATAAGREEAATGADRQRAQRQSRAARREAASGAYDDNEEEDSDGGGKEGSGSESEIEEEEERAEAEAAADMEECGVVDDEQQADDHDAEDEDGEVEDSSHGNSEVEQAGAEEAAADGAVAGETTPRPEVGDWENAKDLDTEREAAAATGEVEAPAPADSARTARAEEPEAKGRQRQQQENRRRDVPPKTPRVQGGRKRRYIHGLTADDSPGKARGRARSMLGRSNAPLSGTQRPPLHPTLQQQRRQQQQQQQPLRGSLRTVHAVEPRQTRSQPPPSPPPTRNRRRGRQASPPQLTQQRQSKRIRAPAPAKAQVRRPARR